MKGFIFEMENKLVIVVSIICILLSILCIGFVLVDQLGNNDIPEPTIQFDVATPKSSEQIVTLEAIDIPEETIPEETKPMRIVKNAMNYTEEDLDILAVTVCNEAGGESYEMKLRVANVVANRVKSDLYPNTFRGVVSQPEQYAFYKDMGFNWPTWADETVREECYKAASAILNGNTVLPVYVLYQAEFKQGDAVYDSMTMQNGHTTYFCYKLERD